MIEGLNVRCNVGGIEVLRSPRIVLTMRRKAVVTTCELDIPDPDGLAQGNIEKRQKVCARFGHRGEGGTWHEWAGTVRDFTTAGPDAVRVFAVGLEQALIDTKITEAMHGEPADVVAKRILSSTGLPVAGVEIPSETLPHIVFSNVSIARAIKQLSVTLERSFGHDLSKYAVWLGESGLRWSAGDEPGDVFVIESASNLLFNSPNPAGMSYVASTILPGLTASRIVRIHDSRRGFNELARAEEVVHILEESGNRTIVGYGFDSGWG